MNSFGMHNDVNSFGMHNICQNRSFSRLRLVLRTQSPPFSCWDSLLPIEFRVRSPYEFIVRFNDRSTMIVLSIVYVCV